MSKGFLPMNGRKATRGFTLVELLVTIAVITILVTVGVPMYGQFARGSAITGATSELVAAVNDARSRAVTERRSMRLEKFVDTDPAGSWSNGWQLVRASDGEVLQIVDRRGRSLEIRVVETAGLDALTFDKEGRADNAADFAIFNPGNSNIKGRALSVSAFGRVQVETLVTPP